jgi:hypothetical protein
MVLHKPALKPATDTGIRPQGLAAKLSSLRLARLDKALPLGAGPHAINAHAVALQALHNGLGDAQGVVAVHRRVLLDHLGYVCRVFRVGGAGGRGLRGRLGPLLRTHVCIPAPIAGAQCQS